MSVEAVESKLHDPNNYLNSSVHCEIFSPFPTCRCSAVLNAKSSAPLLDANERKRVGRPGGKESFHFPEVAGELNTPKSSPLSARLFTADRSSIYLHAGIRSHALYTGHIMPSIDLETRERPCLFPGDLNTRSVPIFSRSTLPFPGRLFFTRD